MASFQSKAYLISGLVNDVVLEIFLHFIAVDSDGPFTLMLVCSDWRDLVISNARMWTWIMVDDFKPDWSTRAHVAVILSRDLPVQLVLRTPSHDIGGLLDTIPRCRTVFLDTSAWSSTLSQGSSMITHEEFIDKRDQYQELHVLVANTLGTLDSRGIETFVESTNNACYSYTTWSTYERVVKAKTLKDQLTDIPLHLIHTLIFEDKPKRTPRRIRLLNIWPHLPSLPYLRWLEISDNFVGGENPSTAPMISLPSLRHLSIDCATGWHFRTKGNAFDLFSLLGRIRSPELRSLILYGSASQLIGAMGTINDGIYPSSLTLSFLSIEGADPRMPHQAPILTQLQQLTLDLFDPTWSSIDRVSPNFDMLLQELQTLVTFVSEGCDMVFRGGEELHHMIQFDMPTIRSLDIIYRVGNYYLRSLPLRPTTSQFRSLTITVGSPYSGTYVPWFQSAQHVTLEAVDLDALLRLRWTGSAAMSILDAGISTMHSYGVPNISPFASDHRYRFRYMTRLRMTTELLTTFIEHFEMQELQEITLCEDQSGVIGPFTGLLDTIFKRRYILGLSRLSILHLEVFPPWGPLTRFVATFNKPLCEGISRVVLPGLPNPSMLRALVEALKNTSNYHIKRALYIDAPATPGCSACVGGGWSCYEAADCRRFSPDTVVSITKDTYVGKYSRG